MIIGNIFEWLWYENEGTTELRISHKKSKKNLISMNILKAVNTLSSA